jgi:hypothetical protein
MFSGDTGRQALALAKWSAARFLEKKINLLSPMDYTCSIILVHLQLTLIWLPACKEKGRNAMRLLVSQILQCLFWILLHYTMLPVLFRLWFWPDCWSDIPQCSVQHQGIHVRISVASWASIQNVLLFISGCVGWGDSWNIFYVLLQGASSLPAEMKVPLASPTSQLGAGFESHCCCVPVS